MTLSNLYSNQDLRNFSITFKCYPDAFGMHVVFINISYIFADSLGYFLHSFLRGKRWARLRDPKSS